jgi:hypothetical protein
MCCCCTGAENGIRTRGLLVGNEVLYQLSYFRDDCGGHSGHRTRNLRIKSPVLYQLSYMPSQALTAARGAGRRKWLSGTGLNRRPNACHAFALPLSYPTSEKQVEISYINLVRMAGIEPARPARAVTLVLSEAGLPVPITCASYEILVPTVGVEPTKRSRADP